MTSGIIYVAAKRNKTGGADISSLLMIMLQEIRVNTVYQRNIGSIVYIALDWIALVSLYTALMQSHFTLTLFCFSINTRFKNVLDSD